MKSKGVGANPADNLTPKVKRTPIKEFEASKIERYIMKSPSMAKMTPRQPYIDLKQLRDIHPLPKLQLSQFWFYFLNKFKLGM